MLSDVLIRADLLLVPLVHWTQVTHEAMATEHRGSLDCSEGASILTTRHQSTRSKVVTTAMGCPNMESR